MAQIHTDAQLLRALCFAFERAALGAHVRILDHGGEAAEPRRWRELAFELAGRNPAVDVHVPRAACATAVGEPLAIARRDVRARSASRQLAALLVDCARGEIATVRYALDKDEAESDLATTLGRAPAQTAGSPPVGSALAPRTAPLETRADADGISAIHAAARGGHAGVVRLLLNARASADQPDAKGGTPLMRACRHGHASVAKFLLDAGAPIDAQSRDGYTALMLGARGGHDEVVGLLCERGANTNLRTMRGTTALALAVEHGHSVSAQLMRANGAVDARIDRTAALEARRFANAWWHGPLFEGARGAEPTQPTGRPRSLPPPTTAMRFAQRRIDAAVRADGLPHDGGGHWRTRAVREEVATEQVAARLRDGRQASATFAQTRNERMLLADARADAQGLPMPYRRLPPPLPEPLRGARAR
jgi:serine/threonine-protein phosphatase 6 regulatory ankyrin repeat subunit B